MPVPAPTGRFQVSFSSKTPDSASKSSSRTWLDAGRGAGLLHDLGQVGAHVERAELVAVVGRHLALDGDTRGGTVAVELVGQDERRVRAVGDHPEAGAVSVGDRGQGLCRVRGPAERHVLGRGDGAEAAVQAQVDLAVVETSGAARFGCAGVGDHEVDTRLGQRREGRHGLGRRGVELEPGAVGHHVVVAVVDRRAVGPEQHLAGGVGDDRGALGGAAGDRDGGRAATAGAEVDAGVDAERPPALGGAGLLVGAGLQGRVGRDQGRGSGGGVGRRCERHHCGSGCGDAQQEGGEKRGQTSAPRTGREPGNVWGHRFFLLGEEGARRSGHRPSRPRLVTPATVDDLPTSAQRRR